MSKSRRYSRVGDCMYLEWVVLYLYLWRFSFYCWWKERPEAAAACRPEGRWWAAVGRWSPLRPSRPRWSNSSVWCETGTCIRRWPGWRPSGRSSWNPGASCRTALASCPASRPAGRRWMASRSPPRLPRSTATKPCKMKWTTSFNRILSKKERKKPIESKHPLGILHAHFPNVNSSGIKWISKDSSSIWVLFSSSSLWPFMGGRPL